MPYFAAVYPLGASDRLQTWQRLRHRRLKSSDILHRMRGRSARSVVLPSGPRPILEGAAYDQLIVRSFGLTVERSQQNCSPGYRQRTTATMLPAKPIPTHGALTLRMVKTLRAGHKSNSKSMGRMKSSAVTIRSLSQSNRSKK